MSQDTKKNNSSLWLNLTLAACAVFALILVVADIFGYSFCDFCWADQFFGGSYLASLSFLEDSQTRFHVFITCFYLCTALAYPIIYCVARLLLNLKKGIVFDKKNTKLMTVISLICILIALICVLGTFASASLVIISMVALFVGLIVQCVRLVMDKAIDMRNELDLTV